MKEFLAQLKDIARSARPKQWLKNLVVFAAAFFWGGLLDMGVFPRLLGAFVIFCLLSSSAYILNDIRDRKRDAKHPVKKRRPIASGKLPVSTAFLAAVILAAAGLIFARLNFSTYFFSACLTFLAIQVSYSLLIRNVIIMDALWVAAAFVVRVYAGAFAIPTPISSWVILSVIGLALLLAFGKRRSERTLLKSLHQKLATRQTLKYYPDALLDSMISMSASYSALAYSIFAFQSSPQGGFDFSNFLPATLSSPKWMMITIPVVFYGIARYLFVVYEKKEGESPEKVLLTDAPLLATVSIWLAILFTIIYIL